MFEGSPLFPTPSGTIKCEHDVVCIPEGVAQASKHDGFLNDFQSTLQFLKYCIQ